LQNGVILTWKQMTVFENKKEERYKDGQSFPNRNEIIWQRYRVGLPAQRRRTGFRNCNCKGINRMERELLRTVRSLPIKQDSRV